MKRILITTFILFVSVASFAQQLSPDQIVGVWESEEYKIEIFKSSGTYSAKLLWAKDMFEADGKTPKKDDKNPDQALRGRSRQGITHITALTYKEGAYVDGKLYSVQDGNTYSMKAELKSANELETRGYRGTPMLGKTFKWKRIG
jgi:uncharacterized protein (DUF2147 family)